jgi:hypothetical protein
MREDFGSLDGLIDCLVDVLVRRVLWEWTEKTQIDECPRASQASAGIQEVEHCQFYMKWK